MFTKRSLRRALGAGATAGLVLAGVTGVQPAGAAKPAPTPLACGQFVTESVTLKADMVCNGTDGLVVIGGSGITINLGGKTIRSIAWDAEHGVATAQVAGVRVVNSTGITVTNGTVTNFAAGVALHGGSGNIITGIKALNNVGPAGTSDLGDGIAAFDSDNNLITKNVATGNGPYGGIDLVGDSDNNQVTNNISNNNATHELCPPVDPQSGAPGCDFNNDGISEQPPYHKSWGADMGFRIEGPGANFNLVSGNTAKGNGSTGIFVTSTCVNSPGGPPPAGVACEGPQNTDNTIKGNVSHDNGFLFLDPSAPNSSAAGSGIHLFNVTRFWPDGSLRDTMVPNVRTTITGNDVRGNARHGIAIDFGSTDNVVKGNTAVNNAVAPYSATGVPAPSWDGRDANANCDNNQWSSNTLGTWNQACVGASLKGKATPQAETADAASAGRSYQRRAG